MKRAFAVVWRALRLWWRDPFLFILLNIGWLVMQIPVITGPAATAAMYAIARKAAQDETLSPREALAEVRRLFIPALKWGLLNVLILGAAAGNFYAYRAASGPGWTALHGLWVGIALLWMAINCFYWPFWLEQEQPGIRQTLFNSALLFARRPVYALVIATVTAGFIVTSVLLTLPLGAALMAWVALIGMSAVDEELRQVRGAAAEEASISMEASG